VENQKHPHSSDEAGAPLPPAEPAPLAPSARSPYLPLSYRRRQESAGGSDSPVRRPARRRVFDASPTTISAVLAKAGKTDATLAWGADRDGAAAAEAGDPGPQLPAD
jgi:hypothetical protein